VKSTRLMIVFCACLAAGALWPADAAAQRGGGSGGGNGGAQPRGGSGGGQRGGGGGGGGGSQAVQRTHPPVANRGYSRPYYNGYYRPYYGGYYRPYYSPYYGGFGYGFGFGIGYGLYSGFYAPYYGYAGYGWGPYSGQYPYPYYGYRGNWASARLEVKPREAQVYVDGFLVGSVDQFDGVFQRLDLPTGEHEIVAYAKGYRSYRQRTLFRPGESYHFKGILEPLPAGAPEEPAPQPSANRPEAYQPPTRDPRDPYVRDPYERDPAGQDPNRQAPPPDDRGRTMPMPERPGDRRAPDSNSFGTLNIRVQPGDATVIIDGERWDSPEGGSRLSVQLSAGPHRVEVRKDGFKPYMSTVQVRPGDTQALNISLPPG
jgi:hypothetical protein